MTHEVRTDANVYGGYDGQVAFVITPEGVIPPPHIGHLALLGPAYDVVTGAVNYLHQQQRREAVATKAAHPERRRPRLAPQQALADFLGTSQQNISRWVNAQAGPRLEDEQWAKLVKLAIAAQEHQRQNDPR